MTHGGHEPHGTHERDPHSLLFGPDEHDIEHEYGHAHTEHHRHPAPHPHPAPHAYPGPGHTPRRAARRRRRRNRRVLLVMALGLLAIIGLVAWQLGPPIYHYFVPADYSGRGYGSVTVQVHPNDGAQAIGDELRKHGVVASTKAFVNAARDDARSANIQPGSYTLPKHIPAKLALAYLLDGKHRARGFLVPEGATVVDVEKRLVAPPCTASSPTSQVCGLGVSPAQAKDALQDVAQIGVPTDYYVSGKQPISAEGFLYPLTYTFSPGTKADEALQEMVGAFVDQVRSTGFTTGARALHITPYQALIIASIAQSEAYFPEDMPKVARVILNRLAANQPLQIDATSAYAAKLRGLDPTKVVYADVDGPYNTYKHAGLPPTPISNPGAEALNAAAHPAAGDWLYYVNADAAGHLFFTSDPNAFAAAVQKCRANHWGCG